LEVEAKARILEANGKTKLLDAKAKLMAEENKIILMDLESINDPDQRHWSEKRQKMIRARDA
jgi:hypothetical protein